MRVFISSFHAYPPPGFAIKKPLEILDTTPKYFVIQKVICYNASMRGKKSKMGRPPLGKGKGKRSVITVRLSKDERTKIANAAKDAGVKLSEWVRLRLLLDPVDTRILAAETEGGGIEPNGAVTPSPRDVKSL